MRNKDVYSTAIWSGYFPSTFNFVYKKDGKYVQCSYCGIFIHYRAITRDHVYPKSKGGILKTPACEKCNIRKKDMLPIEWAIFAADERIDFAMIPIGAEFMQLQVELCTDRDSLLADIAHLLDEVIEQESEDQLIA